MTFAYPHFLWLLLIVPSGMLIFFWWSARTRQKLMTQFIQARLLPGLVAGISTTRAKLRAALLVFAAVFLIIALARPQWGYSLEEVKQLGLDIVVAIDTSKSMLAEDIAPNRLTRAKYAALDLMQQAKSDRLGLVAFAGTAFLQCPLTIDDSAFRHSLESLDVNTLPEGGTALAEAIKVAQQAFKEGEGYKILVLFTDGEDHDSNAVEAAKKAAEAGLRIFTIGIGSAEGELLRIKGPNGQSDFVRDENGNVVKSHLNEGLLREIAGAANGFYLPLRGASAIDALYQKGLAPLPKSESQEKWLKRARDRYHWPLALAIVLLIAEIFFPERKRPAKLKTHRATSRISAAALLALGLALPIKTAASPASALREYKSGKYEDALKEYERSLQQKNADPRLHFNAGAAAYRNQQFDQAQKYFDRALNSPDLKLQEQAYYNLGNTLYQLGEHNPDPTKKSENWEQAIKQYDSSLKLDPHDTDAEFNQKLVRKRLEELKQQQQQQQKQDSKQDKNQKNQKQDQKNQQDQSKQDQQKNSDQQKQDQKQNSDQQKQQAGQDQKPDSKKDQQQQANGDKDKKDQQTQEQKPQPKPGEQKKDQSNGEESEVPANYAPGQMTPQQARQLLDAQKGDEMMIPIQPEQKPTPRNGFRKDW